jgi:hypothetical protein
VSSWWPGRLARAIAPLAFAALVAPPAASGAGRTYEVIQCDPLNRAVSGISLDDAPAYAVRQMCGDAQNSHAIKITNTRFARHGRSGRVRWSTQSPVLRIVGATVHARLRRDQGHVPRLYMADARGHEMARVASGVSYATGFRSYSWHSPSAGAEEFVAHLRCQHRPGCQHSDIAKTWLRNVHFEVADYADPRLEQIRGTLFQPGWIRRDQTLSAHSVDVGSGLQRMLVMANGVQFAGQPGTCHGISGTALSPVLVPCASQLDLAARAVSATGPFHDGRNEVTLCVLDFAGTRMCATRIVRVDNTPPVISFTNSQDPNDPELIRAPVHDAGSGVAGGNVYYRPVDGSEWRPLSTDHRLGELRARINSMADPPGRYEFMARTTDIAGNATHTSLRANGQPMILTFPLRAGVQLSGHLEGGVRRATIGYGQTSNVSGYLRDASGEPLGNEAVTVTEYFGEGALIDKRVRRVQTNDQGRWRERLPSGPSRKVTASYAGSRRYLPDATEAGTLRVRTKATFHLSRRHVLEGHRVAFKGRVGHLAARIPTGGKLVELQVKDGSSWQTVRHPFYTRPNGKYGLHYRFARFYVQNVRYRFRLRVLRERGWPYKTPASSRVRRLVVKAR